MSEERPLHVRVAEALGCKPTQATPGPRSWRCTCPKAPNALNFLPHGLYDTEYLKNYDTSWEATGPLIERYGINLALGKKAMDCDPPLRGETWMAFSWRWPVGVVPFGMDKSPLVAVCQAILSLHAAGKL